MAHHKSLVRYAQRLKRTCPSEAEDLVQDTLVRAIEQQDKFRPGTDLGAWLRTLLHNLNADTVRDDLRHKRFIAAMMAPDLMTLVAHQPGAFLRDFRRALAMLPEPMREIADLLIEGHSLEEIAARQRVPIGTVKSRICRLRPILQEFLDGRKEPWPERKRQGGLFEWTDENRTRLAAMCAAGLTGREMGLALGCTAGAALKKAERMREIVA